MADYKKNRLLLETEVAKEELVQKDCVSLDNSSSHGDIRTLTARVRQRFSRVCQHDGTFAGGKLDQVSVHENNGCPINMVPV